MKREHIKRAYSRKILEKLNADNVKLLILFIPLIIILSKQLQEGSFSTEDLLDTNIIVSFVIVFFSESIAKLLATWISKACEDVNKLDVNYKELTKRYSIDHCKMVKTLNCTDEQYIPVVCEIMSDSGSYLEIEVSDENAQKQYELPGQIKDYSQELMEAHKNSVVYNNRNIRLDDLIQTEKTVVLKYSTTTYYDSLITNRAMDYELSNGKTVRNIFEPGPYISHLKDSKLSNHLGFNGFVELSDGNIIFVMRGKNLSIGKGTWGDSIAASMKAKYCLNDERLLTVQGIGNAIRKEIEDELKIKLPESENTKLATESIIAFYRDLVEGGKPQFLFYYKTSEYDKDAFIENFKNSLSKKDQQEAIIDGAKFHFYTLGDLKEATISSNCLNVKGEKHVMMPSASACVAMLVQWMGKKE